MPMNDSTEGIKKVFLSSTYRDLIGYRKVATEAIQRFGWFTVAMEDFLSQDERPKDLCLDLVAECDLYVGIFAHRYGYIPEGDEQSITEQEYRCACNRGIKCLIFILNNDHPWLKDWIDRGEAEERLIKLKKDLTSRHTCSFFGTKENLAVLLSASLAKYTRNELVGQLIQLSKKIPTSPNEQIPTIRLRVFRHPVIPTDVRCRVTNESPFPTSVRTLLKANVDGKEYKLPVYGHYAGTETWDLPAREGFEGHFDVEEHILKPNGFSFPELRASHKTLKIRIDYSALSQAGKWYDLGHQTYRYDFDKEYWEPLI